MNDTIFFDEETYQVIQAKEKDEKKFRIYIYNPCYCLEIHSIDNHETYYIYRDA